MLIYRYQGRSTPPRRPQECAWIQLTCESGPSQGVVWIIALTVVLSSDSDDVVRIKPKWLASAIFAKQPSIDVIEEALADADRLFPPAHRSEVEWRLGNDRMHICTIKSNSDHGDGSSLWDIGVEWNLPTNLSKPEAERKMGPLVSFSARSGCGLRFK